MKSPEIRKKFFDYFIKRGHEAVASSSLIPAQDPTLLFANAGMNQFKEVFLGKEKRSYARAVSIQKCVRAGGKHNDLDNVGFTKRHLTFFEMMGNFSFGDYFKKEAIAFAWEFLTIEMKIPIDKLHATVFETDDEAYEIWRTGIGLPIERIHRLGAKDNFWQMGETGPCGPCSEIHLDRGPAYGCADERTCGPACDCDRFLEIWNLVFMQFDRQPDGIDKPLKQTGVDTGMGLERLCAVVQHKPSVFQTDLFEPLLAAIEKLTGKIYAEQSPEIQAAFHVLADHIRSSALIIADGGAPSNEGRGYVLRKIIRRAALFAQKLKAENIFVQLLKPLADTLGPIYPELVISYELIYKVLESEVTKFSANLVRGQHILQEYFTQQQETKRITGQQAFKLYDTFGFPLELVEVMAQEQGYVVDKHSFEEHMRTQQAQSGKQLSDPLAHLAADETLTTEFTGYTELETASLITALIVNGNRVQKVVKGTPCYVIAQKSPFFIVGGGQVPDHGWVTIHDVQTPIESVRHIGSAIAALITAPVNLAVGDKLVSQVDPVWRINAMKNHTATHLLQAALITVLGKTIKQSGSLVHPDYLRFDFSYHENLSADQIKAVEDLVNAKIWQNSPVHVEYMPLKQALTHGALAFFGDKYNPESVRMVQVPGFSTELCGGTHVHSTGEIGAVKITEVSALSAGHRRIVAVSGPGALELFQQTFAAVKQLSQEFKVQPEQVAQAILKQREQLKALTTQVKQLKKQSYTAQLPQFEAQKEQVRGINFLFLTLNGAQADDLKDVVTAMATRSSGFYFATSNLDAKTIFYSTVTPDLDTTLPVTELAQLLQATYGIRSGASRNTLQGGAAQLDPGLKEQLKQWVMTHAKE